MPRRRRRERLRSDDPRDGNEAEHLKDALLGVVDRLGRLTPEERRWVVNALSVTQKRALDEYWPAWAHDGQEPPPGDWPTWLMVTGRGFGKTRAGAEWVSALARSDPGLRI